MSSEANLLDYFFGGIIANAPIWVFTLIFPTIDPLSFTTLFTLTILAILGGVFVGYLIKLKSPNLYKWAPIITGILAFFASVLIIESLSPTLIDLILLPGYILGAYLGVKICERYPIKIEPKIPLGKGETEAVIANGDRV